VRYCLGENAFWLMPGRNVSSTTARTPQPVRSRQLGTERCMPVRIVGSVEKGRLHQQQVDTVCEVHQSSDGPVSPEYTMRRRRVSSSTRMPYASTGWATGTVRTRNGRSAGGLPGMPVEMLGDGDARLRDLAVGAVHLVRPAKPRGGVAGAYTGRRGQGALGE
jgi:hypothetical protein